MFWRHKLCLSSQALISTIIASAVYCLRDCLWLIIMVLVWLITLVSFLAGADSLEMLTLGRQLNKIADRSAVHEEILQSVITFCAFNLANSNTCWWKTKSC
jgi:hypothetical protein